MRNIYEEKYGAIIGPIQYAAEAWLQGAGWPVFSQEQHEALNDPTRAAEALGMLQDMRDRIGLPAKFVAPLVPILAQAMRDSVEFAGNDFLVLLHLQDDWLGNEDCDENDQPEDIARKLRAWIDEQVNA